MIGTRARSIRWAQIATAAVVALIAAVGYTGWMVGNRSWAGAVGSYVAMVPATAIALAMLATACVVRVALPSRRIESIGLVCAVWVVASLELVDLLLGVPVALGRLFATTREMAPLGHQVGRMSPVTAVCLMLLGGALLLTCSAQPTRRSLAIVLSLAVANIGLVLAAGYAYGNPLLYASTSLPPALPTTFGLFLLGGTVASMTADRWPLVLFVGDTVRARLVRAALPAVVGSIALFAVLDVIRNRTGGMQNPALASAVFIGAVVTISTAVIHAASGIGRKVDADALVMRETLRDLASSNARMKHMVNDVITAMARVVEVRDPYTQGHERRVAMLATELAVQMELCDDECEGIKLAALVHDVGKLALPAEILNKPGRLSDIEFALIRGHAQAGHDILSDIDFGWPIAQIVLQHHERLDGTGYPNGLLGDEVLMEARIIAVADVVEAMASHRPYRPALGLDTAVKEISDYPEKFDADVTSALLALYADGSLQRMLPDRALIA